MTDQDYDSVRRLLQEQAGIVLGDKKQYLVQSRLAPLLRQHQLQSIGELLAQGRRQADSSWQREIVEALVTTESSFFRDHHPFEALRTHVLPDLVRRRQSSRRLQIWCAATAHGQEPYSLALLLREHFPELATWQIGLLATDLSQTALARARAGSYHQVEVNRGLPPALLGRHFEQHGTNWQLSAAVRGMVEFRELNLTKPWPPLPPMDLILLRNVMIYVDVATKKSILQRIGQLLRPDGYLLLGGAETTMNLVDSFRRVKPLKAGIYQLCGT